MSLPPSSQAPIIILTMSYLQCRTHFLVLHPSYLTVVLESSPSYLSRHLRNLVLLFPLLTNQLMFLGLSQLSLLHPRHPRRAVSCPPHPQLTTYLVAHQSTRMNLYRTKFVLKLVRLYPPQLLISKQEAAAFQCSVYKNFFPFHRLPPLRPLHPCP